MNNIISLLVINSIAWGGIFLLLRKFHKYYTNSPKINILFWVVCITSGLALKLLFLPSLDDISIILITSFYIILLGIIQFSKKILNPLQKNYLLVKIFEILFQQLSIYFFIAIMYKDFALNNFQLYIYFPIFFGLLHFPILFVKSLGKLRYVYFFLSFVGGLVFVVLIKNLSFGFYLGYIIHYLFYLFICMRIPNETLEKL